MEETLHYKYLTYNVKTTSMENGSTKYGYLRGKIIEKPWVIQGSFVHAPNQCETALQCNVIGWAHAQNYPW